MLVRSVALFTSLCASAPAQQLLRDIRPQPATANPGSYPIDLTSLGSDLLFGAFDYARGGQIWRTDGTVAGTRPVTAFPSDVAFQFQLWTTTAVNGVLLFRGGIDADSELWRTDGTRAGTFRVADIVPGPNGSFPRYLTPAGNLVFFTADDGVHGEELWRSDGTAAGTFMVADLEPGPGVPHVFELTAFGSKLMFRATQDRELWISDGTSAGTSRVRDINPGLPSSWPLDLKVWNGAVWFAADDGVNGFELWRSDGTPAGTVLFANLAPGLAGSTPMNLTPAGTLLFFDADDGVNGRELWATDGTTGGTRLVRDILPGSGASGVANLTSFGAKVVFSANDGSGAEPWISDGTAAGTFRLADLAIGPASSTPSAFCPFGTAGLCAFRAATGSTGREPFVTDGTRLGTRLLADIAPGAADGLTDANNFQFGVVGGLLFFGADDVAHGSEPWLSDGTTSGTRMLVDVNLGIALGSSVRFVGRIGDREFFSANDGFSTACWSTDGTSVGTQNAGFPSGPFGTPLQALGGSSYYVVNGSSSAELWSTDGTAAGTRLVTSVPGNLAGTLLVANGKLFFVTDKSLWRSDGTPGGTFQLKTFLPRPLLGRAPELQVEFQGAAYFVAEDAGAVELWRTDGSISGTYPVTSFGGLQVITQVRVVTGRLLFVATDAALGTELFVSDGTAAGTGLLADLRPGSGSSFPTELTPVDGGAFFCAQPTASALQLWFTDGTTAGTRHVATPTNLTLPLGLSAFGSAVLFVGLDGAGREPWISDGTSVGTHRIADLRPGATDSTGVASRQPYFAVVGSGRVALFAANDGDHGSETWRTDGTFTGTSRVTEIGPEQISSAPRSWVRLGGQVLFLASEPSVGEEPFAMSLVATGDSLAAPRVEGCVGTNGVPLLTGVGVPSLGNASFALRTSGARPNALAAFMIGLPVLMNFGPCTLATSSLVVAPFALDAAGAGTIALPVPNAPWLFGGELVVQTLVADPFGGYQNKVAFTNDLLLVVGN